MRLRGLLLTVLLSSGCLVEISTEDEAPSVLNNGGSSAGSVGYYDEGLPDFGPCSGGLTFKTFVAPNGEVLTVSIPALCDPNELYTGYPPDMGTEAPLIEGEVLSEELE